MFGKINLFIKRVFDIISSFLVILLLIPVWIVIPVLIRVDSKGSILFKQKRLTKDGRVFTILKFRSMVVDAEKKLTGLFNYENDPRVTKVGRFLRNSSIDELPQLFNIFWGDMSVIGPRPSVVNELGDYSSLNQKFKKRFQMKAGLTGLAQVKGRNGISWTEKVALDNEYIDLFSRKGIITDISILVESVLKVFRKDNIYEEKVNEGMDDILSAQIAEKELIRIAHLPDKEVKK